MIATLPKLPGLPQNHGPIAAPFRVHAFGAGVLEMWAYAHSGMHCDSPQIYGSLGFFPLGTPDLVAFADTQAEPAAVYRAVRYARALCERIGVPFEVVTAGDLANPGKTKNGTQSIFTPLFTRCIEGHWEEKHVAVDKRDQRTIDLLDPNDEHDAQRLASVKPSSSVSGSLKERSGNYYASARAVSRLTQSEHGRANSSVIARSRYGSASRSMRRNA